MVAGVAEKRPSNVSIKWKQVNTGMSLVFTRETKALISNNLASFCFTSKDTDALVVHHFGSFVNWRKNNIKRSKLDWHFFDFPQKCSLWVIKNPLVKLTRHPASLVGTYMNMNKLVEWKSFVNTYGIKSVDLKEKRLFKSFAAFRAT